MEKRKRRKRIGIILLAALLVLLAGGIIAFLVYTSGYARPGLRASDLHNDETLRIEDHGKYISIQVWAEEATTGYIFYPGGLVANEAYLPYLAEVARDGYYCAVIDAPFHLAILDTGRATAVIADNPQIPTWVVGGHSLGGVAAASWAGKNEGAAEGIIFLASYPTADLRESGLLALSITASNDKVLNWESWEKSHPMLPTDTRYATIEGGNHAGFGDYGPQKGDGEATVPGEEQQQLVAEYTKAFLAEATGNWEIEEAAG